MDQTTTFWNLGGLSFVQGTGGVVPQGPQSEPFVDTTGSSLVLYANSSMRVQGLQSDVLCESVSEVPIVITPGISATVNLTGQCSGGSSTTWSVPFSEGGIAAMSCPSPPTFDAAENVSNYTLYIATLGSSESQTLGNLQCSIIGQISGGTLYQNFSILDDQFWWFPDLDTPSVKPAFDITEKSVAALTAALNAAQSDRGNLFVEAFQTLYLDTPPNIREALTGLVGAMLQGTLSYEVSCQL